jgi:HD-like signal output (HDOD) protein
MSTTAQAVGFSFVEQLAQDLRDERLELPSFPEAVLRIQRMLQSPDTSTDDIVRILSSEPALAARLLRIANSAEFRRSDGEITDLRKAVSRMGFNMVRSVAVAFAMRQLRRKDSYSAELRAELERIWNESVDVASTCFVLAKRFTRINPDQALLAGLLHVVGRLYIVMRAQDMEDAASVDMQAVVGDWHATIGKAMLESWGLPDSIRVAVEKQDDFDSEPEGAMSLTDVLITAKYLHRYRGAMDSAPPCRAVRRLSSAATDGVTKALEEYSGEIESVRSSLGD